MREFMRAWKQQTAFRAKRRIGTDLWQRSYHDHVLRNEESTDRVARYILENPIRAGLVRSPEEYALLGSFVTTIEDLMQRSQDMPKAGGPT